MGDILEKIFAVILIVVLMFFFPLLDAFERMDDLAYMTVYSATTKFVDEVRMSGEVTPKMYSDFTQKLNSTGNKYAIELIHRKAMYYYETETSSYSIRLDEEVNTEQILINMGYYTYSGGVLTETTPTSSDKAYSDFNEGDYFYVSVQNTTLTPATVLKRIIYGDNVTDLNIVVPYGGMVQSKGA